MSLYIVVRIGELSSITLAGAARAVQGDPGTPYGQARAGRSLQGVPGICLRSRNHRMELSIENYEESLTDLRQFTSKESWEHAMRQLFHAPLLGPFVLEPHLEKISFCVLKCILDY